LCCETPFKQYPSGKKYFVDAIRGTGLKGGVYESIERGIFNGKGSFMRQVIMLGL